MKPNQCLNVRFFIFLLSFICQSAIATYAQRPFITVWKTNNPGLADTNQIIIPAQGDFSYTWEEIGNASNNGSGNGSNLDTITFPTAGIYRLKITPSPSQITAFNRIEFNNSYTVGTRKLIKIEQWGDIHWSSMENAFSGAHYSTITATDTPDLGSVTNMARAFLYCTSLDSIPNLNNWDVSHVENMAYLFSGATSFNQNISNWDVSAVKDMAGMFSHYSIFNQPIGNWDVSNVENMDSVFFENYQFNQDISNWNVGKVITMNSLFNTSNFNQPIGNWDVSKVTDMASMFEDNDQFNQSLNGWDVSSVKNMTCLFKNAASFDQPIGNWDVGNVINMDELFAGTISVVIFNQDIANWDVSNVTSMRYLFMWDTVFNQPIGNWNVSNVKDMTGLFFATFQFSQDITNWDVRNVTTMEQMFLKTRDFNKPIGNWDVSNVTNMQAMFYKSNFNQSLENWNIKSVTDMMNMFNHGGLSCENYSTTLHGWAMNDSIPSNISLGVLGLYYSPDINPDRSKLTDSLLWEISGDVEGDCSLGIKTIPKEQISLFPNPVESQLRISGLKGKNIIHIFDVTGRLLLKQETDKSIEIVDISNFSKGVYLVEILNNGYTFQRKVVKY